MVRLSEKSDLTVAFFPGPALSNPLTAVKALHIPLGKQGGLPDFDYIYGCLELKIQQRQGVDVNFTESNRSVTRDEGGRF